jgi:hypothetical protein
MQDAPPFLVRLDEDTDLVEAWATARLPFEPKGWLVEFRDQLRSALKRLGAKDEALLSAVYGSPLRDYCDVENVLIYNVGAGHMGAVAGSGIRAERSFHAPPPPHSLASDARHYWRYRLVAADEEFAAWRETATIASWAGIPMPRLSESTKPGQVWLPLRQAAVSANARPDVGAWFGLRLRVGVPTGTRVAPARAIKPLVDGVISAFHNHDGTELSTVSERLQSQLETVSAETISDLLMDKHAAQLGERRLVWRFRSGVQWNPADDLCIAIDLRIEPAERLELTGRLIEIAPKSDGGLDLKPPYVCPSCGQRNAVQILYGEIGSDSAAGLGDVQLGGCTVTESSPDMHCRSCGHEWGRTPLADFADAQLADFL